MLRKTYARVDLSAIAHNIAQLRKAAGTEVLAVVKADAYGHGMVPVAKRAEAEGVHWFAVATADEAVELRRHISGHILLLSAPEDAGSASALVAADISMCVYTPAQAACIAAQCAEQGKSANIHLKIDTGMHRIGVQTIEELQELLARIKMLPQLQVEGMFTHFATADEGDKAFTKSQLQRFQAAVGCVREAGFTPLCHAANSAATMEKELAETHFDLCRMGIAMYGCPPSGEVCLDEIDLRPAMEMVSHITHVKSIQPGDGVSYGLKFVAKQPERVATVAIGYADGYRRAFSNKAFAQWGEQDLPCIGRVCMDQTMFLATGTDAKAGDEVVLLGNRATADLLAGLADTINYEILTGITARVPRIYV